MVDIALDYELNKWTKAINDAPWGIQQAIKTTLELVVTDEIKVCYTTDTYKGSPCLINAINPMISGSAVDPANKYPGIVSSFDLINMALKNKGVNTEPYYVSPLAAQVLLRNMGPLKTVPDMPVLGDPEVSDFLALLQGSPEGTEIIESLMDGPNIPITVESDTAQ